MGEIADSMINGEFCQHCGTYIGKPVGYPKSCDECKAEDYDVKYEQWTK